MTDRKTASTINDAELDALYERLAKAEQEADASVAAAARLTTLVGKRCERAERAAEKQRRRADIAETELRTLRGGLRANGADPTQLQNLWAQIRLRNRQWREEKQRAEQAEDLLRIAHDTSNKSEAERARAVRRAERAKAAIARVRAAVHVADDEDITDWQRGYRACAVNAIHALDEPTPAPDTEATQATEPEQHACDNCEGQDPDTCLMNPDRRPLRLTDLGRGVLAHVEGVTVAPAAHCGHLSPVTLPSTPPTECALHPGHQGSHADHQGARWWPIAEQQPVDTAHRYCILCGNHSQPDHTCDPAGLGEMYGSLATLAETAHERAEQLASTLREVLDVIAHRGPVAADPLDVARWRAVLNPPKEQR